MAHQHRVDGILHEQRIKALGGGGMIALGRRGEDRAEFAAQYAERIKVVMGARPVQMRLVGHERAECVGRAQPVGVAASGHARVHEARRKLGIAGQIQCDP